MVKYYDQDSITATLQHESSDQVLNTHSDMFHKDNIEVFIITYICIFNAV